jgi:hypothetical protein
MWFGTNDIVWMRFYNLLLIFLLISQALSVYALDPSMAKAEDDVVVESAGGISNTSQDASVAQEGPTNPLLGFDETEFPDAREGYLSLSWNELEGAAEYDVVDSQGRSQYKGIFPAAFISGLSDGVHGFEVMAYDGAGNLLARSAEPAVIEVKHWPQSQALLLFAVGLIVFLSIIAVLITGTLASGTSEMKAASDVQTADSTLNLNSQDAELN